MRPSPPCLALALAALGAASLPATGFLGQGPPPPPAAAPPSSAPASTSDAAPRRAASPWMRLPPEVRRDLARTFEAQLDGRAARHGMYAGPAERWRDAGGRRGSTGEGSWSQHAFDQVLGAQARRSLLAVYAKIRAEGFWDLVGALGWVDAERGSAGIDFDARGGHEGLRDRARARGYGVDFMADDGRVWGLRSPEQGAQLHLRGPYPDAELADRDYVQIHVDLNNPGRVLNEDEAGLLTALGDYALHGGVHVVEDLWRRGETHGPRALVDALRAQGLVVLDVDEDVLGASGVVTSDLLKWDTDGGEPFTSWFGYLWIQPHQQAAGWWTEDEGSRRFDSVQVLEAGPEGVVFDLVYGNGWLQVTALPGDRVSAAWYQDSSGELREFGGRLVEGRVQFHP